MDVLLGNLDVFASGFWVTFQLAMLSFAGALILGTIIATMRVSPVAPLRGAGLTYVETVRNTPLIVVLFVLYFCGPKLGYRYSEFLTAVIGLALYHAAFIAEALRSGINAVAAGQAEAARSIGLTFGQSMLYVVLPQAFRTVVPPLGNIFIAQAKNTALARTISAFDLTQQAELLLVREPQPVLILLGVAAAYMIITLPAGLVFQAIEHRVAIKR